MSIISLNGPGEFVASLGHLLGFHPRRSLILVTVHGRAQLGAVLRVDLDRDTPPTQHASELATILARSAPDGVLVAVIDDQIMVPGQAEFHQPLVDAVTLHAAAVGISVPAVVWANGTTADASWRTREDHGAVPDPKASTLAARLADAGQITYPDRAALVVLLAPTDPDAVARRAARLRPPPPPLPPDRAIRIAQAALDRAERTELPTNDGEIIDLAFSLAHPCGRDAALVLTAEHPNRASELWLTLTRALPAPLRANPAALLGTAAHLTGNGALAGIALDAALLADPAHTLAGLLRQALHAGLTPHQLHDIIRTSAAETLVSTHHQGR